MQKLLILIPLYNDWESLKILLTRAAKSMSDFPQTEVHYLVVNDFSTVPPPKNLHFPNLVLLNLSRNLGHQKAIATGLSYISENIDADAVIIMDADGEDRPEDIPELVEALNKNPDRIIFARRTKREESFFFKLFYVLYKLIFKLATGKIINFGNFSIMPMETLHHVVKLSEIWNNYPGGIVKSKILYDNIPLERGKRIAGESHMNMVSLIMHGLSAVAVHIETVSVRLLIGSIALIFIAAAGIVTVFMLRIFTTLAIPGWATTAILGLSILLMQLFLISLFLSFMVLSYRSQKLIIPIKDYKDFIFNTEDRNINANTNIYR